MIVFCRIALLFLVALLLPTAVVAKPCTGTDLIAQLERENPQRASTLRARAGSIPYSSGVIWKVEKPGVDPSWIFGTMHLSDERLLDLPPRAQSAFETARTLALEITEPLDEKVMASKAMTVLQHTTYLDGTTLDEKLSQKNRALLADLLESKHGMPWSIGRKMRPWALMGMVALPSCELARKLAGRPFLDMALGQRAKAQGKTIVGLETLEGQMKVMASLPEKLILEALTETAQLGSKLEDVFETMIALYEREEIALIWTMLQVLSPDGFEAVQNDPAFARFQEVVVDERNFGMADASEPLIAKGGVFIAVGALHLPGQKGLLNILAQRGYTISRP